MKLKTYLVNMYKKAGLIFLLLLFCVLCFKIPVFAESTTSSFSDLQTKAKSNLNPLSLSSPQEFIGRIIKGAMTVMGSIAIVMFVYGGVLWMTAGGSGEKNEKAKKIISWSALGMVVILGSYAIVNFVFEAFR